MNPSAELEKVVLDLYEGMARGDASAVADLFSRQSGVLAIGSDPNEWWADHEAIARAFETQIQETGPKSVKAGELQCFVESSVGWTVDRRPLRLANGKEMIVRETIVFHKEEGEWKIVQLHASFATPNAEVFGEQKAARENDPVPG